jgi:hypothetical protein
MLTQDLSYVFHVDFPLQNKKTVFVFVCSLLVFF